MKCWKGYMLVLNNFFTKDFEMDTRTWYLCSPLSLSYFVILLLMLSRFVIESYSKSFILKCNSVYTIYYTDSAATKTPTSSFHWYLLKNLEPEQYVIVECNPERLDDCLLFNTFEEKVTATHKSDFFFKSIE